jgi:hypothetical protein
MKNIFMLFDNKPEWKEADAKLKVACIKAAIEIEAVQEQYLSCGAGDTHTRSAITDYIWDLLLYAPAERAKDIVAWRQLILEGKSKHKVARARGCDLRCLEIFHIQPAHRLLREMDDNELIEALGISQDPAAQGA